MSTTKQQLEENIKKLQDGLKNPAIPEQFKSKIGKQIEAAKTQLSELEEAEKAETKAKAVSVPPKVKKQAKKTVEKEEKETKTAVSQTKAILTKVKAKVAAATKAKKEEEPKKPEPKLSASEKAKALAVKLRQQQGLSTQESDVDKDAGRPALPAGKRISAAGNVYYENRENRIDRRPAKYPKLEDGGMMARGGATENDETIYKLKNYSVVIGLDRERPDKFEGKNYDYEKVNKPIESLSDLQDIVESHFDDRKGRWSYHPFDNGAEIQYEVRDGKLVDVIYFIVEVDIYGIKFLEEEIEEEQNGYKHGGYMAEGGIMAHGEGLKHEYKIHLADWECNVYEDDYEEGEGENVNNFSERVAKTFDDVDGLIKYISANILYKDLDKSDFHVFDNHIATSILVDADNSPATDGEIELWKEGEIRLYSANYTFYLKLVSEKEPTEKELMVMFDYPIIDDDDEDTTMMARGGNMLPYVTKSGKEFYIEFKGEKAIVTAKIEDEDVYMLDKEDLREMSQSARIKGIKKVELHTNYGLELHSKHEKPQDVGFDTITKESFSENNFKMARGGSIDADRFAKPAGWRWKDSAVEHGIIKKSALSFSPSLKMREKYPEYVYFENRLTKADVHPSRRYQSLKTGGSIDADRFAKPAGWRWKDSAVEHGIIKKSALSFSPSLKMRQMHPEYVYFENRLTKADLHPSRKYQSLEEGGTLGNNGLLYALVEFVSSGTIGNMTGLHKYKDIDKVRFTAIEMLQNEGDRLYSLDNLKELLLEAKNASNIEDDKPIFLSHDNIEDDVVYDDDDENIDMMANGGKLSNSDFVAKTIVYDNGGKTFDRYTVFTPDGSVYGMSETASGFNQYLGESNEVKKGSHLGKRLSAVPKEIEWAVIDRMEDSFAKGGKMANQSNIFEMSTYIPNRNIQELMITVGSQLKTFKGEDVYDGVYLKKEALGKSSTKILSQLNAEDAYSKILEKAKVNRIDKQSLKNLKKDDVEKLIDAGYTLEDLYIIYIGVKSEITFECNNEVSSINGLFAITDSYVEKFINALVKAGKENKYELGLKYPLFNWQFIIKKYNIKNKPIIIETKRRHNGNNYYIIRYELFVGDKVVLGHQIERNSYKNNKLEYSESEGNEIKNYNKINAYQKERESMAGFNTGYWGIVSSEKSIIYDITKMLVSQEDGYVKDLDFLYNRLGGVGYKELDENDIKYEHGGMMGHAGEMHRNNM